MCSSLSKSSVTQFYVLVKHNFFPLQRIIILFWCEVEDFKILLLELCVVCLNFFEQTLSFALIFINEFCLLFKVDMPRHLLAANMVSNILTSNKIKQANNESKQSTQYLQARWYPVPRTKRTRADCLDDKRRVMTLVDSKFKIYWLACIQKNECQLLTIHKWCMMHDHSRCRFSRYSSRWTSNDASEIQLYADPAIQWSNVHDDNGSVNFQMNFLIPKWIQRLNG